MDRHWTKIPAVRTILAVWFDHLGEKFSYMVQFKYFFPPAETRSNNEVIGFPNMQNFLVKFRDVKPVSHNEWAHTSFTVTPAIPFQYSRLIIW